MAGKRTNPKVFSQAAIGRATDVKKKITKTLSIIFFLKVCYLDCAKFDGLLESLYTIVKKSLPKCIFFELQPGSDSRIGISVATWNG